MGNALSMIVVLKYVIDHMTKIWVLIAPIWHSIITEINFVRVFVNKIKKFTKKEKN